MDDGEQIFAEGESAGTDWVLSYQDGDLGGVTWLRLTTAQGATHKGGYGGPSLHPGLSMSLYTGSSDRTPNGAILRVPTDVTEMRVSTSDGISQAVQLARHPTHENALVGAVVYPAGTQITRVTVADAAGRRDVPLTQRQV